MTTIEELEQLGIKAENARPTKPERRAHKEHWLVNKTWAKCVSRGYAGNFFHQTPKQIRHHRTRSLNNHVRAYRDSYTIV